MPDAYKLYLDQMFGLDVAQTLWALPFSWPHGENKAELMGPYI